jgi:hypothetical protein
MKGFITKTVTAVSLSGAALGMVNGCYYRDIVDPCYPQRYEYAARMEVNQALAPQVRNGHILEQTVWNYEFEPGTARLTAGGMDHLAYLARRRPAPDTAIYLQVAQPPDVMFDPKAPDKFAEARAKLDNERVQAIQSYLTAETSGRNLTFTVVLHDPGEVGIPTSTLLRSIVASQAAGQGILTRQAVGGGTGGK